MTVIIRIKQRFRERAAEWFCAANMMGLGVILMHPSETFVSPSYEAFRQFGENATGLMIGGLGLLWLLGLIINGARQSATSTIRAICAFIGAVVYGLLGIGFTWSFFINGILSTGVGTYSLISLLALYSLFWIGVDKRING